MDNIENFLKNKYGFDIISITEAPRGFYGETYILKTRDNTYFVKIDYTPWHKNKYKNSFKTVEFFNKLNFDFVPKIIFTIDNKSYTKYNNGILGVFEYIEGKHTDNYKIESLFSKLVEIYKLDANKLKIEKEYVSLATLYEYEKLKNNLKETTQSDILSILNKNENFISHNKEKLLHFYDINKKENKNLFITHGDAGGNCIINDDKFYIIDWDEVSIAPIERDLWFFMHKKEQIKEILQTFKKHNFSIPLDYNMFAYYCYKSFFKYMCEHINNCIYAKDMTKAKIEFSKYFNSWIIEQIKFADTL